MIQRNDARRKPAREKRRKTRQAKVERRRATKATELARLAASAETILLLGPHSFESPPALPPGLDPDHLPAEAEKDVPDLGSIVRPLSGNEHAKLLKRIRPPRVFVPKDVGIAVFAVENHWIDSIFNPMMEHWGEALVGMPNLDHLLIAVSDCPSLPDRFEIGRARGRILYDTHCTMQAVR